MASIIGTRLVQDMTWILRLWICAFLLCNFYSLVEQNIYRADLLARVSQLGDLSLSLLSAMNLVGIIATLLLFNWRKSGVALASVAMLVSSVVYIVVAAPLTILGIWLTLFVSFVLLVILNRSGFAKKQLPSH